MRNEFFKVKFSNFLFSVEFNVIIVRPILTIDISEKVPFFLSSLWSRKFSSFCHIKWKSKKLLSIGWHKNLIFSSKFLNSLRVVIEIVLKLLNSVFKRSRTVWFLSIVSLVNNFLNSHWISSSSFKLIQITKSSIFNTMNLTNSPEDIIFILTHSLNFEVFSVIWIN